MRTIAALTGALCALLIAATPAPAAPGDLDPSFGDGGKVVIDGSEGRGAITRTVVVQRAGRIIAVGTDAHGENRQTDTALYGFDPYGQVDYGFGSSGEASFDEGHFDHPTYAVRQSTGAIVVTGTDYQGAVWLARFTPDGRLDTSFGDGGVERLPYRGLGAGETIGVAVDRDDRIVIAFKTYTEELIVAVRHPDGGADPSFSGDGFLSLPHDRYTAYDVAVATLRDGRIVVGIGSSGGFTLDRLTPAGDFDRSFSGDGARVGDLGGPPMSVGQSTGFSDLAVRPNGAIVVVGWIFHEDDFNNYPALAKFTSAGKVDRSFGRGGHMELRAAGRGEFDALVLPHGGKVVAVGYRSLPDWSGTSFLVARYLKSGRPDRSFSDDGWATAEPLSFNRAFGVALEPTGNIVVSGFSFESGQPDMGSVVRFFGR